MKKYLYTLFIAYFLVGHTLAQHTNSLANDQATHTLVTQFATDITNYETLALQ